MKTNRDRTCHAWTRDGAEIVRYERAGKWYVEYPPSTLKPRKKVTLKDAVALAVTDAGVELKRLFLGRPGGGAFDSAVVKARSTKAPSPAEPATAL